MTKDKQLYGIRLEDVLEKRRLDQALNAKEFAVLAGVSYTTARSWFRLPGFPIFHGVLFWQDFVLWRTNQNASPVAQPLPLNNGIASASASSLPPRAVRILREAENSSLNGLNR
jgi:hypothetical protein